MALHLNSLNQLHNVFTHVFKGLSMKSNRMFSSGKSQISNSF